MRGLALITVLFCLGTAFAGVQTPEADSGKGAKESEPRHSLYMTGASVGYLFPISGSYSYQKASGGGVLPTNASTESPSQILRVSMQNILQFNSLLLSTDGFIGLLPDQFILGADMSLNYLFGKGMVSPFAGGWLGIHYGPVDDGSEDKLYTSPAVNAQGGLLFFRGYDVNIILRGQYVKVLGGDRDNGVVADAGVVYSFQATRGRDDR